MNLVPWISTLARGIIISLPLGVSADTGLPTPFSSLRQLRYILSISGSHITAPPLHLGCGPELLGITFKPAGTLLLRLLQIYLNSSFSVLPF